MRIPNADRAHIDPLKLHSYLLSKTHPEGKYKAVFFESLGYSAANWERLESDLRIQHLSRDAVLGKASSYGQKYEILAPLTGPWSRTAIVLSVWMVPNSGDIPRFVTAFPGD